jgi:type VI secretion system protein ImpB
MADTFQNEVPKARINLKLALHTGGAQKKVELPLKLLTIGDFSNGKENRPLSEREKINVNKNNLTAYFRNLARNHLTVPNTLAGDGAEENVSCVLPISKILNRSRLPGKSQQPAPCWRCVIYYAISNPICLITPLSEKSLRKS